MRVNSLLNSKNIFKLKGDGGWGINNSIISLKTDHRFCKHLKILRQLTQTNKGKELVAWFHALDVWCAKSEVEAEQTQSTSIDLLLLFLSRNTNSDYVCLVAVGNVVGALIVLFTSRMNKETTIFF